MARKSSSILVISISLVLVVGLLVTACAQPTSPTTKPVVWRFHTWYAQQTTQYPILSKFFQEVETRSKGQLKFEQGWGGVMGLGNAEMMQSLRDGLVEIAQVGAGYVIGQAPLIALPNQPGVFSKPEQAKAVFDALLPYFKEDAARFNSIYLTTLPMPFSKFATTVPVRKIADFRGLKFRAGSAGVNKLFEQLGITFVSVPIGEAYMALKQGIIQGQGWGAQSIDMWGWYDVMRYVVDVPSYDWSEALVVNKTAWDKLPKGVQNVMTEAAARLQDDYWQNMFGYEEKAREICKSKGVEFIKLSAEDEAQILAIEKKVLQDWMNTTFGARASEIQGVIDKALRTVK